jgi:type 1 glutamine amidotransferase
LNKAFYAGIIIFAVLLAGCEQAIVEVSHFPATVENTSINKKIVFIAGADSHAEGEHEHKAGVELLSAQLRLLYPEVEVFNVIGGWPTDEAVLTDADVIVIYGDGGPAHVINDHLATVNQLVDDGVGFVVLHYAVEVARNSAAADVMQRAVGGYFETHWSVNPFWEASFTDIPAHPISEAVASFTLFDEWYFNMRFVEQGVTSILSAVPPAATMQRWNGPHSGNEAVRQMVAEQQPQTVAWVFERDNGGRGFAYTGGHYLTHWDYVNTRQLVINGIVWTADRPKLEQVK